MSTEERCYYSECDLQRNINLSKRRSLPQKWTPIQAPFGIPVRQFLRTGRRKNPALRRRMLCQMTYSPQSLPKLLHDSGARRHLGNACNREIPAVDIWEDFEGAGLCGPTSPSFAGLIDPHIGRVSSSRHSSNRASIRRDTSASTDSALYHSNRRAESSCCKKNASLTGVSSSLSANLKLPRLGDDTPPPLSLSLRRMRLTRYARLTSKTKAFPRYSRTSEGYVRYTQALLVTGNSPISIDT